MMVMVIIKMVLLPTIVQLLVEILPRSNLDALIVMEMAWPTPELVSLLKMEQTNGNQTQANG